IRINHINKMEGHAGFMASVLKGDVKSAKLEIKEGIRLIEGILIGRHYKDVPVIVQRICGICPVVHNLTAIKAMEKAMGVKISQETKDLRRLLEWGQIIHSHALHLFFLSLADLLDIDNDLKVVEKYPEETKMAIRIREFGMEIVKVIGGRVIHPLTNEVGGFKKVPTNDEIKKLIQQGNEVLETAQKLGAFFAQFKFPEFEREAEYVCLGKGNDYAIYEGDIVSNKGLHIPVEKFENNFHELQKPNEVVKKVETLNKNSYMIGAIARINNNASYLKPKAEMYLESLGYSLPDYNSFHNVIYQMVEVIHAIEESINTLKLLENKDLSKAITGNYEVKEGIGVAAVEAPRGTLYYHIDIDQNGYVKNANIITPTAQSLAHLEMDIALYLKDIVDLPEEKRTQRLRGFIRAYDPCISCAVH
ncbi:MAG: Ni/Fe hydrogenase subunit alpha, partial [Candidatus Moranbacteria bacterium]|nr:Ni/Fe hydrogenase subunit alpha [Candidatus Moranbacteria bacterium]